MTSELKPFLEDMLSMSTGTDGRTLQIHFCRPVTMDDRLALMNAHNAAVTRAVPDVRELVRYEPNHKEYPYFEMEECENGDYVRYDQTAAIIAAKEDQISLAETTMIQMHQELSALEAKLAASEAEIKRLRSLNHYAHLEAVAMRRAEAAEAKLAQYEAQEPLGGRDK